MTISDPIGEDPFSMALDQMVRHAVRQGVEEGLRYQKKENEEKLQQAVEQERLSFSSWLRSDEAVMVLVNHQSTSTSGCICGWSELGKMHPRHVLDKVVELLDGVK